MKTAAVLCVLMLTAMSLAQSPRARKLLDFGWRFHLGNAADMTKDFGYGGGQTFAKGGSGPGPIQPSFDDSAWREINVPHDWVVEQDFVHDDDGLYTQHGSKPTGRKFPESCIGWYRRTFDVPATDKGQRLSVEFDGVFRDSLVWLNGHLLGREQSGYTSFAYDMTDFINYGGKNVLTVRVDASQYEGWFYEGAGIYRHVWLVRTSPVHIARRGTFISSDVKWRNAKLKFWTTIANDSNDYQTVSLKSTVMSPDGKMIVSISNDEIRIAPWSTATISSKDEFQNPDLWSLETPNLYVLNSVLRDSSGRTPALDTCDTSFGIRTIRFDKDQGFFLNDKHIEIQGTCDHQDHAGVGVALPDRLQYFRIEKLKEMGCNAIRTSHNPPTPELLDACDKLGMLVMDENRLLDSSAEGMHQLESLVRRDRNHPSVILWSIGNEEWAQDSPIGAQIAATMVRRVHDLDPSRPVTYAGNNGSGYEGVNSEVDVRGVNYITLGSTDEYHKAHPDQPMVGSEEASTLSTRGEYANDPARGYMSSYDTEKPGWGATAEEWWTYYAARPYLAGAFVWTGFDYRGEPTPYGWPCISSHFGIMDTCGFPKDNFYYYQAWWKPAPMVHILPHWNWKGREGKPIDVCCYSNADEVELLVNGKGLGRKSMPRNGHLSWSVSYVPGVMEARAYTEGRVVAVDRVETTGAPTAVVLTPDRSTIDADGEDVSMVTVSVVDAHGRVVPEAANDISFSIEGGSIVGVGNGDPSSHENDQFVDSVYSEPITGWKRELAATSGNAAVGGKPEGVDVSGGADGMKPHTMSAYVAAMNITDTMLKGPLHLSIGQIDDEGTVFVNGKEVAKTNDWSTSYSFDISPFVQKGMNAIMIIVKNNDGPGGLGGGVNLNYRVPAQPWHRSVFHGLAQIIVRGGMKPGQVKLSASSAGISPAECTITAKAAPFRGYEVVKK